MTLLSAAASGGHVETVSYLLGLGLNPNIPDRTGSTALHFAVLADSPETVNVLLRTARILTRQIWTEIHRSTPPRLRGVLLKHGCFSRTVLTRT